MPKPIAKQNCAIELKESCFQFSKSSEEGYNVALKAHNDMSQAIGQTRETLKRYQKELRKKKAFNPQVLNKIREQIDNLNQDLSTTQKDAFRDINESRKQLKNFTITLFGRTMAGKSTLMEILTQGDGRHIGIGKQRTTRDIRHYKWNHLTVIDVPGIAAFEGKEDEDLAIQSAINSDLILLLITDDAPQPEEARFAAHLRSLGKPVLGVLNIKSAIDDPCDMNIFLRAPQALFDSKRTNDLVKQFNKMVNKYKCGQKISFIASHLRSRFLANRPDFASQYEALVKASRFELVEQAIIKEVEKRGAFLTTKTFIDKSAVPMMNTAMDLQHKAELTLKLAKNSQEKLNSLRFWRNNFAKTSRHEINTFVTKLKNRLDSDLYDFTENHYEDEEAGRKWQKHVNMIDIQANCERLQKNLVAKYVNKFEETKTELQATTKLLMQYADLSDVQMNKIFPTKMAWNLGVTALSTVSGYIAAAFLVSNPVGWLVGIGIGIVGTLFSFFFDSTEQKRNRQRDQLRKNLGNANKQCVEELRASLMNWLNEEVLAQRIDPYIKDMTIAPEAYNKLYTCQSELAQSFDKCQKELNRQLVFHALQHLKNSRFYNKIQHVRRIPGTQTILITKENPVLTLLTCAALSKILDEKVSTAKSLESADKLIKELNE